jgi:hypothetical protein
VVDGRREPSSKRSGLVSVSRRVWVVWVWLGVGGAGVDTGFRVLVAVLEAVEDELGVRAWARRGRRARLPGLRQLGWQAQVLEDPFGNLAILDERNHAQAPATAGAAQRSTSSSNTR